MIIASSPIIIFESSAHAHDCTLWQLDRAVCSRTMCDPIGSAAAPAASRFLILDRLLEFMEYLGSQSGFAPENFTTLSHFFVSSAMSLPKSAGEPGCTEPPSPTSRAVILGSATAAFISLFSLSMIAAGVLLGTAIPYRAVDS